MSDRLDPPLMPKNGDRLKVLSFVASARKARTRKVLAPGGRISADGWSHGQIAPTTLLRWPAKGAELVCSVTIYLKAIRIGRNG